MSAYPGAVPESAVSDHLLLFVCEGNLARSPAAELISRHRVDSESAWSFASCGVRAVRSDRVLTAVGIELDALGVPRDSFTSRQATIPMLGEATLILTASAPQNAWIVDEAPGVFRRTYLMKQAARLLADLPPGEDPLVFMDKTRDRPLSQDEIEDPFRKSHDAAQAAVEQIDAALRVILPALGAV